MELSIVIATHDRHAVLRSAIAAVERQTLDADAFELIVVDNSSDRKAQAEFLADLAVDCRCDYALEELPGAARARNIGTRLARGHIVAFLDDDAVPDPGWAEAVLHRFGTTSGIGVLGGPVVPIWPAPRPDWLPPWADALLSALDHGAVARPLGPDEHLISANMAFPKPALEAAGGFPEHLGRRGSSLLSNEDLALRRAIVGGGRSAYYDPRVRVRHRVHAERLTQDWLRRRMAWQIVSDLVEAEAEVTSGGASDVARLSSLLGDGGEVCALFADRQSPDDVSAQLQGICLLVRLLLARSGHACEP